MTLDVSFTFRFLLAVLAFWLTESKLTALERLDKSIKGRVITNDTNSTLYDSAKQIYWIQLSDAFPSAIIQCKTISDVRKSIEFALKYDESFVVRSGGHSSGGFSTCSECIVIDLIGLKKIKIKEKQCKKADIRGNICDGTVEVQVGNKVNDLAWALEFSPKLSNKYWLPMGLNNVGIGGHISGGGWGHGVSKYGLTSDNVMEAKVLIVDSKKRVKLVRASETKNPDLFYCIRNVVGPSCGIVVEFKLQVFKQPDEGFSYSSVLSIGTNTDYQSTLDALTSINTSLTDSANLGIITTHLITAAGPFILSSTNFQFFDSDIDIVTDTTNYVNWLVSEIQSLGAILVSTTTNYGSYMLVRCLIESETSLFDTSFCSNTSFLATLDTTRRSTYSGQILFNNLQEWEQFTALDPSQGIFGGYWLAYNNIYSNCPVTEPAFIFCGYYTSTWGGAVSALARNATPFDHRESKFDYNPLAFWADDTDDVYFNWYKSFWLDILIPLNLVPRSYVNYVQIGLTQNQYMELYYGENQEQLVNIKCQYDPSNVFTSQQGIPTDSC